MTEVDLYLPPDILFLWDHPHYCLYKATALFVFLPILERRKRRMRIAPAIEIRLYQ